MRSWGWGRPRNSAAGRSREDLFFRLNVFPIDLPPLRERRDDIPLLMEHSLALYSLRHKRRFTGFTRRAVEALLNYSYPGNIRELQIGAANRKPGALCRLAS
jgi:DNA-binding NtrC family response regulator